MKITEINAKNYTVYQPTELKKTDIKQSATLTADK